MKIENNNIMKLIPKMIDEISRGINTMGTTGKIGGDEKIGMSSDGIDLSFIKKIKFDINNRFLIG